MSNCNCRDGVIERMNDFVRLTRIVALIATSELSWREKRDAISLIEPDLVRAKYGIKLIPKITLEDEEWVTTYSEALQEKAKRLTRLVVGFKWKIDGRDYQL